MEDALLFRKYNVAGPRYTSYPTVPFWKNPTLSSLEWMQTVSKNFHTFGSNEISVYIHLPFCESMCTFCGCHKRITKNHSVEEPYLDAVLKEWKLYLKRFPFKPIIKELHLGGGTPTFFEAKNLKNFLQKLLSSQQLDAKDLDFSFEAHPNNTTEEHLKVLFDLGFKRLSLGVQDYSEQVQIAINRIQSLEQVQHVHSQAKSIGYTSISHDLVFGLPKQTLDSIELTVNNTLKLMPERISLYSYAHVPWIKGNGQRGFEESDLPKNEEKRALYELAKSKLEVAGYIEIGMDHFALPSDSLYKAFQAKKLHRNFMGYTTQFTPMLIGLGMSSISDSWFGFSQNIKDLSKYLQAIEQDKLPIERGHILSEEDVFIRQHILDLMCHFETQISQDSRNIAYYEDVKERLQELFDDGLIYWNEKVFYVTEKGIPFVRNICMAFDVYLLNHQQEQPVFSKTV
jgi:oxygen-independent coproporphyrinogen III oxidase